MFTIQTMTTTNYINSNGLELKVTQLPSGDFDLYFSNGFISTCYTEEELQDLIQRKGFQQIKQNTMKKIAWNEPAQPANRDDYFSSLIGPEMDADKAVEIVDRMQKRVDRLDEETVSRVSSVLLEMVKLANELSGMDNTLTKREALLVCMGFTTGEAYVYGKYRINK